MATYRGGRLSKRQKRRSLKRKNVKSRKVMRGGKTVFTGLGNCEAYVTNARNNKDDLDPKFAIDRFFLGKFKEEVKGYETTPCKSKVFYENFVMPK